MTLLSSSDFLSNLLVLLLRILNSGLSDSGLLVHLSEATAGSLNGVGHSTVYEELGTYSSVSPFILSINLTANDIRSPSVSLTTVTGRGADIFNGLVMITGSLHT